MEKIQFKRATNASGLNLADGEIGITRSSYPAETDNNNSIYVGIGNNQKFRIRNIVYAEKSVITDIQISDNKLQYKKTDISGTTQDWQDAGSVVISGTIDKAKQLVRGNGTTYTVGQNQDGACQPIYFANGVPAKIDQTCGAANRPVWMDDGVIKSISGNIGNTNRPVYIDSNGAISPITQSTGSAKLQYFSNGTIVTNNGKIGGKKKPIYYDGATGNGFAAVDNFDDDGNYTGTTVKSKYINLDNLIPSSESKTITINGTDGVSLAQYINTEGLYMVVIQFDGDYYTYMIFSQRTGVWHSSTAYIKYGTSYIPTSIFQESNWYFYWKSHSGSLANRTGTIVQIKKIG